MKNNKNIIFINKNIYPCLGVVKSVVVTGWDLPTLQPGPRLKSCSARFLHALSYPDILINLQLVSLPHPFLLLK